MLFKKAELFNGIKNNDSEYFECFKNPTSKEWRDCIEQNKIDNSVRAMLLDDGTCYVWTAEIDHYTAMENFGIPEGVYLLIDSPNEIEIDCYEADLLKYIYNAFKNTTSLYNYVNRNANVIIIGEGLYEAFNNLIEFDDDGVGSSTIPEILKICEKEINKEAKMKIKRLIKKGN